jgi:hypothetical protein
MNRYIPVLILLTLGGFTGQRVQAQDLAPHAPLQVAQSLPNSGNNNPYNSPIRRANPNSMQGTQPSAPAIRSPNIDQSLPAHRNSSPTHRLETRAPAIVERRGSGLVSCHSHDKRNLACCVNPSWPLSVPAHY